MQLGEQLDMFVKAAHDGGVKLEEVTDQVTRRYILRVLKVHRGNRCRAAVELGIHRNTLARQLEKLQIARQEVRALVRRAPRAVAVSDKAIEERRA